jgi:hypothetical protein
VIKEDITVDTKENQKIIREYFKKLYPMNWKNPEKMVKYTCD